jgi:hypothetical protein
MPKQPATNKKTIATLAPSATGCDPAPCKLTTWQMGVMTPDGIKQRQWATVQVGTLIAGHFESGDNALEALALQLEDLARKIRKSK